MLSESLLNEGIKLPTSPAFPAREQIVGTVCLEIMLHNISRQHSLGAEELIAPVMNYLVKDVCAVTSLGRQRQYLFPKREAGLPTVQYSREASFWSKSQTSFLPVIKDLRSLC